ncbi:MAG: enoyl-CoA hydratase/isomerase family protein [Acidobacteriota bacterium]
MEKKNLETVKFIQENSLAKVILNRPEVHNAFNEVMIQELLDVFDYIKKMEEIRVVILTGQGKSFCSGADLNWMKKMKEFSYKENFNDALKLAELLYNIYSHPKPTIVKVNGAAIGGGTGLVSVCDIAVASEKSIFGLSEVKIGLIPAVISPYLIRRCGEGKIKEFFLTGERIDAFKAKEINLINYVVKEEQLEEFCNQKINQLLSSGPRAIEHTKKAFVDIPQLKWDEIKNYTAEVIAKLRISEEGQEGLSSYIEKRKPYWNKSNKS